MPDERCRRHRVTAVELQHEVQEMRMDFLQPPGAAASIEAITVVTFNRCVKGFFILYGDIKFIAVSSFRRAYPPA